MHAKAGESDRAIRVKMVSRSSPFFSFWSVSLTLCVLFSTSPNICLLASGRWARRIGDDRGVLRSLLCIVLPGFRYRILFLLGFLLMVSRGKGGKR
jgi:hypothetical protein